ncbi:MAG: ATP-dependent Clp protease ATP-binding subunit [Oscillospiraceae bacterium]|jgi:ATP-dependent Clp protease ATP-binding subunit ClpA|nr:ATP-dependent Clp protease ATP-binding subunit [Oscillospiraceae bacterium]
MQPALCSRCKKNVAIVFVGKDENGKMEGYCLKCAKELNIRPIKDILQNMGISDEELESITDDMMEAFNSPEGMDGLDGGNDGEDDNGKTATFPFLKNIFGASQPPKPEQNGRNETGSKPESGQSRGHKRKFLDNYCINLTARAGEGKLDKMIGREEETERVIQILNRRQKNNPCLIGEPGVGKTAIAEGLAQKIVKGEVPYKLREKEVWLLDLTSLVAGTQFRGQFESRMKGLIDEIKKQGNIILVIDEVHNIVGAGDAEGSMNAANILKPALSRGEIQVIGATTFSEYRKYIEKDSALERRFQPVTVAEPSVEDSVAILKGIKKYYEDFHGVIISDEMCEQAVRLSERYITDRYLPDKAIDLLDEACSDVNLKNIKIEKNALMHKELDDLAKEREMLLSTNEDAESKDYERLAEIRSRELQLQNELSDPENSVMPALSVENLARIIELWTKIPASSIKEDELKRLAKLDERLKKHIIGQDEAIDAVCAAIRRRRVGVTSKLKPVSFIFVGSTGVGKTELVKQLAADLFNSPESLIRLDMSEFMEKHAVSRIIGSPPGYVGYDEAGQLTEKIRRKPYSVILFDEIEKAHPDVMNILLQILDDGHITDAHGKNVNFENTVIIMTTNAGSERRDGSVGFNRSINEQGKEKSIKALNDFLRPEFINRVDEIVYFNRLSEEDFTGIAKLMLDELKEGMAQNGYSLEYDDAVAKHLAEKSYSVAYGARNLRRTIQKDVEDAVTAAIVNETDGTVKNISVSMDGEEIIIKTS